MEDLQIINNSRPSEIHTIIAWDAKKYASSTIDYLKTLPKHIEVLYKNEITLTKEQELELAKSVYTSKNSRVKNSSIYLVIIKDTNPIYSYEKATSCWQVLNKNMKIIKEDMRLKIGGSKRNYHSIHTSYNQEEALFVLKPLNLTQYVERPSFENLKEFFDYLNKHTKLKYLILRSSHEIEYSLEFFKKNHDIDILVNDYYYFKALTGARSLERNLSNNIFKLTRKNMRENDNGYHIQSTVNIGGVEIPFDIRFVGDDYVDSNWEKDMLNRKIKHTLKNNIVINIPNNSDELYSLIYHIIIQKPHPHRSKHIKRVKQLLKEIGSNIILDFNNIDSIKEFLNKFMNENEYKYKKPFDIRVGFII